MGAMSLKQVIKLPGIKLYLGLSRSLPRSSRPRPNPRDIHKILLMAFGGIGDSLRMIPLIRMLGETFPAAELATLTNQSRTLFDLAPEGFPACRHLSFDFDHGVVSKWKRLRELRRERFDLIVLPIVGDGFVEIGVLARLIGARYRAGFDLDGGGLIYTHSVAFRHDQSILAQYGDLLSALGCAGSADNIPLRRDPKIAAAVMTRLQALGLAAHQLIVVLPKWVITKVPRVAAGAVPRIDRAPDHRAKRRSRVGWIQGRAVAGGPTFRRPHFSAVLRPDGRAHIRRNGLAGRTQPLRCMQRLLPDHGCRWPGRSLGRDFWLHGSRSGACEGQHLRGGRDRDETCLPALLCIRPCSHTGAIMISGVWKQCPLNVCCSGYARPWPA